MRRRTPSGAPPPRTRCAVPRPVRCGRRRSRPRSGRPSPDGAPRLILLVPPVLEPDSPFAGGIAPGRPYVLRQPRTAEEVPYRTEGCPSGPGRLDPLGFHHHTEMRSPNAARRYAAVIRPAAPPPTITTFSARDFLPGRPSMDELKPDGSGQMLQEPSTGRQVLEPPRKIPCRHRVPGRRYGCWRRRSDRFAAPYGSGGKAPPPGPSRRTSVSPSSCAPRAVLLPRSGQAATRNSRRASATDRAVRLFSAQTRMRRPMPAICRPGPARTGPSRL